MSHGKSDEERIRTTHNTARYFTENRHVAWIVLIFTVLWGIYAYAKMPKLKDPYVPVRVAAVTVAWPGASAEKVEELITRKVEEKIAENTKVEKLESNTRGGVTIIFVTLQEGIKDTGKEFDDIKLKLDTIDDLPQGSLPINFIKDFGDTAALMLTMASPKVSDIELQLRADTIQRGIEQVRTQAEPEAKDNRTSLVYAFPASLDPFALRRILQAMAVSIGDGDRAKDPRLFEGPGYIGIDFSRVDEKLLADMEKKDLEKKAPECKGKEGNHDLFVECIINHLALDFLKNKMHTAELHPDVWRAIVVFDPKETEERLRSVAESKYSYREMDDFSDSLERRLRGVPEAANVKRYGVLDERVYLEYSQERLSQYNIQASSLSDLLSSRNTTLPAGVIEAQGKNIRLEASGEFKSESEIGEVIAAKSSSGSPVYLRDAYEISRDYESPARYLNKMTWRDKQGQWQRTRAATLAVQMRSGRQIGDFGEGVDKAIEDARSFLPEDLVIERTSDQPGQVEDSVELFMTSLYEAVLLVVLIALVGFWEWRSAFVLALSIPITLFMTFGLMYLVGIDIQQISIASLIIALGLLVDDPVVATDAIKRDLAIGNPRIAAAWLGPTKLARAILFATITNIVAYLPFLLLPGDTGIFIYSLPVVLAASLVASRLVSMTFIPMLGYYLLRPPKQLDSSMTEKRSKGFGKVYSNVAGWAIDHRWTVLVGSLMLLVTGGYMAGRGLKTSFFPKDLQYLSYVDVWLPEDAPISATNDTVKKVDDVIRKKLEEFGKKHPDKDGKPRDVLKTITTFVGGGGPRFWFTVSPEQQQLNYGQLIVEVYDKHFTNEMIPELQEAFTAEIPGARVDTRQLETGLPVGLPVSFRLSGDDIDTLRRIAEDMKQILRNEPTAERVRDDWGAASFQVRLEVDPDRASAAGITNLDVAASMTLGLNGNHVSDLREGHREIPIVSRLRASERGQLADVQNLYIASQVTGERVPLRQVSSVEYRMATERILRRNHYRTITVGCYPVDGKLPSEVLKVVLPKIEPIIQRLPPGYRVEIGGEDAEQTKAFKNLAVVLVISVLAIFLALVIQFKNAMKPLIVFAAIPYGVVGALLSLLVMDSPFGFMAFLGVISLIGVIVSHVIVLFDFIEERHEEGEPLRDALIDAGILRLRPVLITVGATVIALFPLASHGGPLWEPLCYTQIGGLLIATFITLLIVPVLYAIFVNDLKLVQWEHKEHKE